MCVKHAKIKCETLFLLCWFISIPRSREWRFVLKAVIAEFVSELYEAQIEIPTTDLFKSTDVFL